jgi:hypothetical protein
MAFASLLAIPARINPVLIHSLQLGDNGLVISFVPTIAAGTPFDLTAATSYTICMDSGVPLSNPSYLQETPANTLLTASNTGGSLSIAAVASGLVVSALVDPNYSGSGRITISATDGTNTVIVAAGTWSYQPAA